MTISHHPLKRLGPFLPPIPMKNRCWSSLPFDLLHRVAGCFLDSADIHYYMDFRAVCRNWRAATDDPRNTLDSRYRPRHWIMLDYWCQGGGSCVLVNTATGRFHGKKLPVLRDYFVASVTDDGLLILAGRASPHTVCVLNPFTGYMVRFAAPLRPFVQASAVSSSGSSPPSLVLYCRYDSSNVYTASPENKRFVRYKSEYPNSLVSKAVVGCVYIRSDEYVMPPLPAAVVAELMAKIYNQTGSLRRCFLVESAGETLVLFKFKGGIEVYKIDMDGNTLEPVNSIGSRAIFFGGFNLAISVEADKFPSIEANCIYHINLHNSPYIDMYNLKDKGQMVMASTTDQPAFRCDPLVAHPMTIIKLLLMYTLNIQGHERWTEIEDE